MEFAHHLLLVITITSILFLLIGLYKPWVMLWWEDIQNRRKVLWLYGSIAVVSFVLYGATGFLI